MATNTYVALKSGTITGSTVSYIDIDLTGITGYTDLRVVMTGGYTYTDCSAVWQFNGDTTSSYSYTFMYGQGSGSGGSYRGTNQTNTGNTGWYPYPNTATTQGVSIVDVMNFSNPNIYKTILIRNGVSVGGVWAGVSTWRKTDPITSIKVDLGSYNNPYFTVGSTYTVYGIAAEGIAAKATGGVISSDETYWYHTFTSSGVFTPTQSITADYFLVGGGGGGGSFLAGTRWGYGGAGGYTSTLTSKAMSATAYTITVGSGGAPGTGSGGANGSSGTASSLIGGVLSDSASGGSGGTDGQAYSGGLGAGNINPGVTNGYGGIGITSSFSGTSTKYVGGGSYGNASGTPSDDGSNYGGGLTKETGPVVAPIANRGGGGGGGQNQGDGGNRVYSGQTGGSGVVIIRYPK